MKLKTNDVTKIHHAHCGVTLPYCGQLSWTRNIPDLGALEVRVTKNERC